MSPVRVATAAALPGRSALSPSHWQAAGPCRASHGVAEPPTRSLRLPVFGLGEPSRTATGTESRCSIRFCRGSTTCATSASSECQCLPPVGLSTVRVVSRAGRRRRSHQGTKQATAAIPNPCSEAGYLNLNNCFGPTSESYHHGGNTLLVFLFYFMI